LLQRVVILLKLAIATSDTHQCAGQLIERLACSLSSKISPARLNAHPCKKFYWKIILLKVVLFKVESFYLKLKVFIDLLKVILLNVKSLLKVESHYLKTMTWGIYMSKMSINLVNSISQTLHFSLNMCVEMKRESLPSLVNRILHWFKLEAPHKGESGASAFCSCICGAQGGCSRFRVE
jgi:hypothetical protein